MKKWYTILGNWINVITLLIEKILKTSTVDKTIDEKETLHLQENYNLYIDKRKESMKNTSFKVEDFFSDIISKDNISQQEIIKLNSF